MILDRPKQVRLKWLEYYVKIWEDSIVDSKEYAEQLILSFVEEDLSERHYDTPDFSAVADALTNLKDKIFLKKNCTQLLAQIFERIKLENWTSLLQNYDTTIFIPIFRLAADTDDVFVINHVLQLLRELRMSQSEELQSFANDRIGEIPDYLQKVQVHQLKESGYSFNSEENRKKTIKSIVENLLVLSAHQESDNNWIKRTIQAITKSLPRKYVNKVLFPILISGKYREQIMAKSLCQICRTDLISRTRVKPSPPTDWQRKVPGSKNFEDKWEILRPFLESKTEQIFDYAKNQSYRKDMEYAIKSVTIDLKMETIRKGSPHTLRLTKTQAAYERSLKKWEVDVELLKRLRESGD